jgi:hypothetical protein
MLEFIFGFFSGIFMTFIRRSEFRSIGVQADEVWSQTVQTQPILIPNSKIKFIPKLQNFWGSDS